MDELEFALLEIGGTPFEEFSMDFLRAQGYEVHESGSEGRDGGWDARIKLGDNEGIAHASKRKDWKVKLRKDAKKVEDLETELEEEYDIFAFITNRHVSGEQQLEIESEIRDDYGWNLRLHHQTNILGELRQNHPELADRHLGIELKGGPEYQTQIQALREDRLDVIESRIKEAEELGEGPVVALHIIPNGLFTHETVSPAELEPPLVINDSSVVRTETRGKMKYTYEREGDGYAFVRNDGLFETATSSMFWEGHEEGELWIGGAVQSAAMGIDAAVILTVRNALKSFAEAGYSGVASVSLSFLNSESVQLLDEVGGRRPFYTPSKLGKDRYSTEFSTVDIDETEIIRDIEPMLSEVWREFGIEDGTKNIQDGEWQGRGVKTNAGSLKSGDG